MELSAILAKRRGEENCDWDLLVKDVQKSYNISQHSVTGFSPFYLLYAVHPRMDIDNILPVLDMKCQQETLADRRFRIYRDRVKSHENTCRFQLKRKIQYDESHPVVAFEVGDKVLYKKFTRQPGLAAKYSVKWSGPYEVMHRAGTLTYMLRPVDSKNEEILLQANAKNLKKYTEAIKDNSPQLTELSEESDYDGNLLDYVTYTGHDDDDYSSSSDSNYFSDNNNRPVNQESQSSSSNTVINSNANSNSSGSSSTASTVVQRNLSDHYISSNSSSSSSDGSNQNNLDNAVEGNEEQPGPASRESNELGRVLARSQVDFSAERIPENDSSETESVPESSSSETEDYSLNKSSSRTRRSRKSNPNVSTVSSFSRTSGRIRQQTKKMQLDPKAKSYTFNKIELFCRILKLLRNFV